MTSNRLQARRRGFSLFAAAALFLFESVAFAQPAFPSKPITFVVPFSAGGSADVLARIWAEFASKELGTSVVVDNRPGANGLVAMQYVARAPADGYTLLMNTGSLSLNPFTYKNLSYKNSDFEGVALLGTVSQVLVAHPALGIRSVGDLVKRAKERPNELAYGSAGIGNSTHLNVEILARHYGVKFLHSPYKGAAPALMGVISGEAQFMVDATTSVAQIRAGKVVPLAVFGLERLSDLPSIPTIHELGLRDSIDGGWYAISVPTGTPKAAIERLNTVAVSMWKDTAAKARLDAANFTRFPETGVDAVKSYVDRDAKLWGPLITDLGIQKD